MAHGGPHAAAGELLSAELAQPAAEHALLLRLGAQSSQHTRQRMQYAVRLVARACNIPPQLRQYRQAPASQTVEGLDSSLIGHPWSGGRIYGRQLRQGGESTIEGVLQEEKHEAWQPFTRVVKEPCGLHGAHVQRCVPKQADQRLPKGQKHLWAVHLHYMRELSMDMNGATSIACLLQRFSGRQMRCQACMIKVSLPGESR